MTGLVQESRQVKPGRGSDAISRLGRAAQRPFQRFTPKAFIRYLLYLPLNFIPVVGTLIFIILQGKNMGPAAHKRYFDLKRFNSRQRADFVEEKRGAYTSFGVVTSVLELIPVASILFTFTNTVGAALWAADMEQKGTTAPSLKKQSEESVGPSHTKKE